MKDAWTCKRATVKDKQTTREVIIKNLHYNFNRTMFYELIRIVSLKIRITIRVANFKDIKHVHWF